MLECSFEYGAVIPTSVPRPILPPTPSYEGSVHEAIPECGRVQLPEHPVNHGPGPQLMRVACKSRRVMTHNGR
jgi:hypothetical protein